MSIDDFYYSISKSVYDKGSNFQQGGYVDAGVIQGTIVPVGQSENVAQGKNGEKTTDILQTAIATDVDYKNKLTKDGVEYYVITGKAQTRGITGLQDYNVSDILSKHKEILLSNIL